jgi:SAM-dependent methyltransferase
MDLNSLSFNDEEFDIVISSEVVEHAQCPEILIKNLSRVLKQHGLVILTTPHQGGSILARLLGFINGLSFGSIKKYEKKYENDIINDREKSLLRFSSEEGKIGSGLGHVSVKSPQQWRRVFRDNGFIIQLLQGTGGMLFGCPYFDKHRILFSLSIILDVLMEYFPFSYLWSENLLFELRKNR